MRFLVCLLAAVFCHMANAATTEEDNTGKGAWKGSYYNKEYNIHAKLNLEEMNIPVPGLELDSCYGYFTGRINGAWYVLKVKERKGNQAVVRAISERGADAQDIELTLTDEGISLKLVGKAELKGVDKNKYVKLPKPLEMLRE